MAANLYFVLGVGENATQEEIKAAYRRKAKEVHPDHYGSDARPFREVQEAYNVLSDPSRRRVHDQRIAPKQTRSGTSFRRSRRAEPMRDTSAFTSGQRARPAVSILDSFETYSPSLEAIFERLWSNFELTHRPKSEDVLPLNVDIELSPEEAFRGGSVRILIPSRVQCPSCAGYGHVGSYECWECEGHGAFAADAPVDVSWPTGLVRDCVARVPLRGFGITNLYLAVRFRVNA